MQNVIGIIVILAILGGGYYFYTQSSTPSEGEVMEEKSGEVMEEKDGEAMEEKDGDAMMEENGDVMEKKDGDAMMEKEDGAMMEEGTGNVVSFTVEGQSFSFAPNAMNVKKGDTVRVTFKNVGGFHDFVIDEFNVATKQINSGQEETVEFVADKTGSFEFYCSVGNHRAQGMFGTLNVSE